MKQEAMGRTSEFLRRHRTLVVCVLIAAAFAIAHGAHVKAGFRKYQWEDRLFIQHNDGAIHSFGDCFTRSSVWPGLYRPLTTNLYYFVGRKLFSNRIEVHHLISIDFYLANGFLLYLIGLSLIPLPWAAIAPIIFVSRLSHAEVVANSCEFQSLLSVFFTLLALKLFIASGKRQERLFQTLSMMAFTLALLSKETAVVFPALLIAFGWLLDVRFSWRRYLAPTLAAGLCIVLFVLLWQQVAGYQDTGLHFDASFSNIAGNYSAYLLSFFNLLTYKSQSIIMAPAVSRLATTPAMHAAFIVLLAACVIFFMVHKKLRGDYATSARMFVFGILFFVIVSAPYVILTGRQFMRYGYLGHAGLALSSAALLGAIARLILRRTPQPV